MNARNDEFDVGDFQGPNFQYDFLVSHGKNALN